MTTTAPANRRAVPTALRLAVLVAVEAAIVAALHWLGRYRFLQLDWGDLGTWARDTPPEDALTAAIRVGGLVVAYWALVTTLAQGAQLLAGRQELPKALSWASLPGARRLLDAALAASVTGSAITTTLPAAPAGATTTQAPDPDRDPDAPAASDEAAATRIALYPQSNPLPAPDPGTPTYTVAAGDSYGSIAADQLANPDRWADLYHLNRDRIEATGLDPNTRPQVGWQLVLPADATNTTSDTQPPGPGSDLEAAAPAAARLEAAPPAGSPPDALAPDVVTVEAGDNLWDIAEERIADHLDRPPAPSETGPYWQQLVSFNTEQIASGDPDLIHPGEDIVRPALGPEPPAPAPPPATPPAQAPTDIDASEAPNTASPPPEPAPEPSDPAPAPPPPTTPTATTSSPQRAQPAPPTTERPDTPPTTTAIPRPDASPSDDDRDVRVLGGVTALLAAVTVRTLARRRRARRRSITPNTPTADRPTADIDAERHLAGAAGDTLDHTRRAVRALRTPLRTLPDPPTVTGIVVAPDGRVTIHLDRPTTPAAPFTAADEPGPAWQLDPDADTAASDSDAPPLETLVTLGHTAGGDTVFLDLESLGAITIAGDPERAAGLARSIAAELALAPLDQYVDLTIVGDLETPDPQRAEQGVVRTDRLSDALTRQLTRLGTECADYLAANDTPTAPAGRARGLARDGLFANPVFVAEGADPVLLDRLATAALPGGRNLAIVALDPLDHPATQLVAHPDGTLDIPHLGLSVTAAGLAPHALARIDQLLDNEPDTAPDLAPLSEPSSPPPKLPEPLDWEYVVRVLAGHRVERRDGHVISFKYGENAKVPNKNTRRGPELLAYLALRPGRAASTDNVRDDLWWGRSISEGSANTLISGTRRVLGGADYLTNAIGDQRQGRYHLATTVVTDVELLEHALAQARAIAPDDPKTALDALRPHLAAIEAPAFESSGIADWATATRTLERVERPVIEAALLAADLARTYSDDGLTEARWAIDQALIACPTSEPLVRAGIQLDHDSGDRVAADHRYRALAARLAFDDLEPEDATTDLHHQLLRNAQRIG